MIKIYLEKTVRGQERAVGFIKAVICAG